MNAIICNCVKKPEKNSGLQRGFTCIKSYSRRGNVQIIFKEGVKTRNVVVERQNNMVSVPRELMQYCLGSRDGAVVKTLASHQCGPGSTSYVG